MKRFLTILLLLLCVTASSQTTTFSFTAIPLGTDFVRPGAGFERWNRQNDPYGTMHIPVNGSPQRAMDYYERMSWNDFFLNPSVAGDSTFDFTKFDQRVGLAKAENQAFGFGVMSQCNNCDPGNNNLVTYNGGQNSYPKFLHDLMQSEGTTDWLCTNGDQIQWVANFNSPHYLRWVQKTCDAIRAHINTTSSGGTPMTHIVKVYDIRFFGNYGEFHQAGIVPNGSTVAATFPAGTFPTAASLDSIVSKQIQAFRGLTLFTIPFNALDANWLPNTVNPQAFSQWLIEHPDSVGFRWDHLSDDQGYDHNYWELNNRVGGAGGTARILNRWKYSLIRGEPPGYGGQPTNLSYLPTQVTNLHLNSFGNGNYGNPQFGGYDNNSTTAANNARTAARLAGYRLRPAGGFANIGASLVISLDWLNEGITPTYESWTVQYLIKNGAGTTVSTLTSNFNPLRFLPSGAPTTFQQSFGIPAIPAGPYGLYVIVKDPNNYRQPMPLAITPRQSDGSYFLGNITIPAGGSNLPPVANAGPNQSIVLPDNDALLTSAGSSDPDGTISSRLWSQVSGPNTATNSTPTATTTTVGGLIAGVYVFNVTVTDNLGATGSDQVQITVQSNNPPVANAGVNQSITLPTSSVTVDGSASTDDIAVVSYAWSQFNGPNTANIVSPNSANSTINGLIQGTYTFRLTVTDGSGLTSFDDMNVTVSTSNTAPTSNAGPDQTIFLPTTSVTLDGTLSFDNGSIASYQWTQVGGAAGPTIVSPTSAITNVTGLSSVGAYIFRLTVLDNTGLPGNDDVQITVQSTGNNAPVANAGPNQTITLPTSSVTLNSSASTDDIGIVSRVWSKQSGPSSFTIVSPTSVSTSVTGLVAGVYTFRITVTDGGGLTDFNDVTITVNAAANAAPIANAGGNQAITLPTSSTSVSGSGSTDDVAITAYLWTKVSGPAGGTIATPTTVNTNITALQQGTYVFRLRVTDGGGLFDEDDVQITVNPAANNAPVAIIAGGAQTIQLPVNTVALDGSGSTDDVAVTAYLWTQVSGPSTATIQTPTASTTNMNNLVAGVYFFQLQVSDAGGLTDTDIVQVTVDVAAPPDPPVSGGHSLFKTGVKFLPRIP